MRLRSGYSYGNGYGSARSRGTPSDFARNIAATAGTAAASYVARRLFTPRGGGSSYTATRNNGGVSQNTTTYQHDVKTQYTRKRMPRRKRKRWVKFVKKVNAVNLRSKGLLHQHFVDSINPSSLANLNAVWAVSLYGCEGTDTTSSVGQSDLKDIFATALTGGYFDNVLGARLQFGSAQLDITLSNLASTTCIIDVYTVVSRKDVPLSEATNLVTYYANCFSDVNAISVTKLTSTSLSATPFSNSLFCSRYKVLKKVQYIVGANQVVNWQFRDPRNHNLHNEVFDNLLASQKHTISYLFVQRGAPGTTDGAVTSNTRALCNRSYHFTVDQTATDATELV